MDRTDPRINRRRFLAGTFTAAAGAAAIGLQRRTPAKAQPADGTPGVRMEDVRHSGPDFARGRGLGAQVAPDAVRGPGGYEGPIVESSFAFTHAGVHWSGTPGAAAFAARTSADGRQWTAWQPLLIEAGPGETPSGETFAALIAAPRHRYLQYRATLTGGGEVDSVTTTLINSADGPSLSTASAPAHDTPVTFTREQWGADESLRFDSDGNEIWPVMFVPHKKLVVHHTATTNNYSTVEEAKAEVRAIYAYHATSLDWGDIGYNALIDKWGNVYEGRYGQEFDDGREVLSTDAVAGHAAHHNYGSSGIALLGTHTARGDGGRPGVPVSDEAYEALVAMLAFEADRNHTDPHASSDFALFNASSDPITDNAWNRGLDNIAGHRDCQATICPGGHVYELLPAIRDAVAGKLKRGEPGVSIDVYPPETLLETVDDTHAVSYAWTDAEGLSYAIALEGWKQKDSGISPEYDITYLHGYTEDRRLIWQEETDKTSASFDGLTSGHYTFHVVGVDELGNEGYRDTRTFLLLTGADEDSEPDPEPDPDPEPGDFELTAEGYKVRGLQKADLSWSGTDASEVEILRDGIIIDTVANTGSYTDDIDNRGGGSYVYQVCEAGTGTCSNEATVEF